MMKDFIARNKPVFIIGLITVFIFVGIIIIAQKNPAGGPTLEKIRAEEIVKDYTFTVGPSDAPLKLVEFSDFECPACKAFSPVVDKLLRQFPDKIYFVYKHFPLPQHPQSRPAAIAAQAAREQGKFWEYANILFDNQPEFEREDLIKYADQAGLDVEAFSRALDDPKYAQQVDDDAAQAGRLKIQATPTFIANDSVLNVFGPEDLENKVLALLEKANVDITKETTAETPQTTTPVADTTTPEKPEPTTEEKQIDSKYGVIEIAYTDGGFNPDNVKAVKGQLARFINKTKQDMTLQQVIRVYDVLRDDKTLKPGESFEFRLDVAKLWTYKEASKRIYGSIWVAEE